MFSEHKLHSIATMIFKKLRCDTNLEFDYSSQLWSSFYTFESLSGDAVERWSQFDYNALFFVDGSLLVFGQLG